ncbi:hypothetical protein [Allosphingosinicella indica]|uniref:Uncharacterized protein n=1 Tax=Allosphingosinicella indica TaxID=941907 RepID=A0A1X7FYH1_9SPHN|nr:hypothetical protein [Allosphingosinicella indica]SMF61174.1 hypothetical protein SAMN06295910_0156 [Allosphingosinicella indica]
MGPFDITKEMVADLSDESLRELLRHLLETEAKARGIAAAGISVGGNQTAGDGGVDASIVWTGDPKPQGWLPRRMNVFQSKAEAMGPAKIKKETRRRDKPRPIFTELARTRGSYIIFSTDDPSASAYDARITAMREAVADVPNNDRIALDFYGADKIARWANEHVGIAGWLTGKLGRPRGGWEPYGNWSRAADLGGRYVLDDTSRAKVGGAYVPVAEAISRIRTHLAVPGNAVRLIGLSGMGKTRFAEALFDKRLQGGSELPPSSAIYADAGLQPEVSPALLTEQLAASRTPAIIVVDNCSQKLHGQLAELVKRDTSQTSLLTIDYDVDGEGTAGLLVSLANNSEVVLVDLLGQRFPKLSRAERAHLAKFSGGNARIALKIAEASRPGVDVSKLNDSELLDRLFQVEREGADDDARLCAAVASLVYAFYAKDHGNYAAEYPTLAGIAETTAARFHRAVSRFLDWGIVQMRGPQRAVMPQPLANMLAAPFIRQSDPAVLIAAFSSGPRRLFASFARRIGQLHDVPEAVEIARLLLDAAAPLGRPGLLDDVDSGAFVHIAPCNPESALAAIERELAGPDRDRLLIPDERRRDFTQLLVQIAHDARFFQRVLAVLTEFTLADGDVREELRARNHLLERFWPIFSFTHAKQAQRLSTLDEMLASKDDRVVSLGVEALDHMMDSRHFSSSLNLEFGARALLSEWRPYNGDGYGPWFKAAYDRLVAASRGKGALADRARQVIAQHFREHVSANFADLAMEAMRQVGGNDFWEEGWRNVNDALHFQKRRDGKADRADLIRLEQDMRPRTIDDLFKAFVLGEPWRHWHPSGRERSSIRKVGLLARAMGKCLVRDEVELGPYIARATSRGGFNSARQFGVGLARATRDPEALWRQAYGVLERHEPEERDPSILDGMLQGSRLHSPGWVSGKLDEIIDDPLLGQHLVELHTAVPLDEAAVERFRTALKQRRVAPDRFAFLMSGGVTQTIPAPALARFLRELFDHEGGQLPAMQVLHMRIYGDRSDGLEVDKALIDLGRDLLARPEIYSEKFARQDHGIDVIANVALRGDSAAEAARRICRAMVSAATNKPYSYPDLGSTCQTLMRLHPRVVLEEIVARSDNDHLIEGFFGGWRRNDEDFEPNEIEIDMEVVFDWLREDPAERSVKLANFIPYTTKHADGSSLGWSPMALELLTLSPDRVAVLLTYENRFFSGGGSGSFALRFVRRRPLVAAMAKHESDAVRGWAAAASERLEATIVRWDEREAADDSLFE